MPRRWTSARSAATIVAALWLSGCAQHTAPVAEPSVSPTTTAVPAVTAPLPDAAVLTGLLDRLADPAVPGADKLGLIENAGPGDAATLDNFTRALRDNQMLPLTFGFESSAWSDRDPADVVATITIIPPPPKSPFSFPMDFIAGQGGWQLSRATAEQLLAFGSGVPSTPVPATPTR